VRFTYDALGRRISKSDGTNETRFFWDGMRLLQEECKGLTSTYLYEQDSYAPLARMDQAEHEKEPRIYYFHCNASGQPEEMTDSDGKLIWRGRYSTFGKVSFETVTRHTPRGFQQNLRMQGQYEDKEVGLCYNTFRYYDPDIGRFTTEDPIGLAGGVNLYQYAPNPLNWIDPWGWCVKQQSNKEAKTTALTKFYPENNGFLGKTERIFLMPGDQISRYGSTGGKFFSPSNTPLQMRALPPNSNTSVFNTYKVLKPFEVEAGKIMPAFGQPGLGTQYLSPVSADTLLKRKIIGF
jgi:RHS repeat-associated protein